MSNTVYRCCKNSVKLLIILLLLLLLFKLRFIMRPLTLKTVINIFFSNTNHIGFRIQLSLHISLFVLNLLVHQLNFFTSQVYYAISYGRTLTRTSAVGVRTREAFRSRLDPTSCPSSSTGTGWT